MERWLSHHAGVSLSSARRCVLLAHPLPVLAGPGGRHRTHVRHQTRKKPHSGPARAPSARSLRSQGRVGRCGLANEHRRANRLGVTSTRAPSRGFGPIDKPRVARSRPPDACVAPCQRSSLRMTSLSPDHTDRERGVRAGCRRRDLARADRCGRRARRRDLPGCAPREVDRGRRAAAGDLPRPPGSPDGDEPEGQRLSTNKGVVSPLDLADVTGDGLAGARRPTTARASRSSAVLVATR